MPAEALQQEEGKGNGEVEEPFDFHGPQRAVDGTDVHTLEDSGEGGMEEIEEAEVGAEVCPKISACEIIYCGQGTYCGHHEGEEEHRCGVGRQEAACARCYVAAEARPAEEAAVDEEAAEGEESSDAVVARHGPGYVCSGELVEVRHHHAERQHIAHQAHVVGHGYGVWHAVGLHNGVLRNGVI